VRASPANETPFSRLAVPTGLQGWENDGGAPAAGIFPSPVVVVDDDPCVRRAVARALRAAGYAVETFASGPELLARGPDLQPACAIVDLRMPGVDGLELQARLHATGTEPGIVFLSGHADVPAATAAMRAGAVDFLEKPIDVAVLLAAVHRAVDRHEAARRARAERDELAARLRGLTRREREVMALVVGGLPNKRIAGELGTSEKTIKVHRARVMAKMAAPSLADLVRMSIKLAEAPG
jgi:FixJ family two-component response regulator